MYAFQSQFQGKEMLSVSCVDMLVVGESASLAGSRRRQTAEAEARLKTAAGDWTAVAAIAILTTNYSYPFYKFNSFTSLHFAGCKNRPIQEFGGNQPRSLSLINIFVS